MNADTIRELAGYAADVVEALHEGAAADGFRVTNVQLLEMADGSGRWAALIDLSDGHLEQQYRLSTPAPATAPAWAGLFVAWRVEVRIGDSWRDLGFGIEDSRAEDAPGPWQRGE